MIKNNLKENKSEKLQQLIKKIIEKCNEFELLKGWIVISKIGNKQKTKVYPLPVWKPQSCDYIFKKTVNLPEKFMGMSLAGSQIDIRIMFVPGGKIYINNKLRDEQKYWFDSNLTLTDSFNPLKQKKFNISILTPKQQTVSFWGMSKLFIKELNKIVLEIEIFLHTLNILSFMVRTNQIDKKIYENLIIEISSQFDWTAIESEDILKIFESINKVKELFIPFNKKIKEYSFHFIGHAHIDMNWLWNWPHTLDTCQRTFNTVDKLMDKYPDFKFSQSQAVVYEEMEKHFPEVFAKIKKRVQQGKWDITASTWVEGDINMASGESLVRQTLYAKQYIREKFNKEIEICWCPDTFGHPVTYPQILKKSGIKYYYCHRCGKKEKPVFWWESPDGSRVLVFNDGTSYNGVIAPSIINQMIEFSNKTKLKSYPLIFGVGDHGGGPTIRDLDTGLELDKVNHFPRIKFDKSTGFYKSIENKTLPVIKDELNYIFEGCYTTHSDIKSINRKSENMLYNTEILATLANLWDLLPQNKYPGEQIKKAWKNTCFNQFHDILDGSGIHETYPHSHKLFKENISICDSIIENSIKSLNKKIKYSSEGIPVCIINTLGWNRKDITEIKLKNPNNGYLTDNTGKKIPFIKKDNKIVFVASVPSLGYTTYYWKKQEKNFTNTENKPKIEDNPNFIKIETKLFNIVIDKITGCISSLYDKRYNKEFIPEQQQANIFELHYEKPHGMSAWYIGQIKKIQNLITPQQVKVIETNSIYTCIHINHKFNKSEISQDIIIYSDIPKIDFKTKVNWQEKGGYKIDAPMLKVAFPTTIISDKASFEIPFGTIQRPTNGAEVPALKWVDLSDTNFGVSLLNDCKYGHSIKGNTIKLTLIRSSYEPDPIPDIGKHQFTYSIYPHKGNWKTADTILRSYELNIPLKTFVGNNLNNGILPDTHCFVSIDKKNVIIAALKKHEYSKGIILRVYESEGKNTTVKIKVNFGKKIFKVKEIDLQEIKDFSNSELIKNKTFKINLKKNEIKTFLIY